MKRFASVALALVLSVVLCGDFALAATQGEAECAFPVEYTVYGQSFRLDGYSITLDEEGNTEVRLHGWGIPMPKLPDDSNRYVPITAEIVWDDMPDALQMQVAYVVMRETIQMSDLSTKAILNELVFVLDGEVQPQLVTLFNFETGEELLTFEVTAEAWETAEQ